MPTAAVSKAEATEYDQALSRYRRETEALTPHDFIAWADRTFGKGLVMSTSFGIHSAVMLHLVTRVVPSIPVIWIDTGYLFPETYRFAEDLTVRLNLNLHAVQPAMSSARMEALYGRFWEQDDVDALNRYDQLRKVQPMLDALRALGATAWLAGLRSDQTSFRRDLPRVDRSGSRFKLLPILGWSSKQMYDYLQTYDLPIHPLFDKGYVSAGDWHSSRPLRHGDGHERETRFRGLKEECGLHTDLTSEEAASLDSSGL